MRLLPAIISAMVFSQSPARCETVILWNGHAPPSGIKLLEDMRLSLDKGALTLELNQQKIAGQAHAVIHEEAERICTSDTLQKVVVRQSSRDIRFSFGNSKEAEAKASDGKLLGKSLTGKKTGGRWSYTLLNKDNPDPAEASALSQFAIYTQAVDSFGLLYGTEPHSVGDTWKPDISALKNIRPGIDADLAFKLEQITQRDSDTIARITFTGHISATLDNHGTVQIAVNAVILRSLRDMLDLDTRINGNFKYTGQFGKGDSRAVITAPVSLVREVKVEKR